MADYQAPLRDMRFVLNEVLVFIGFGFLNVLVSTVLIQNFQCRDHIVFISYTRRGVGAWY